MMRLLLTILAALGFVWAALNNAGAQERLALEPPAVTDSAAEPASEAPVAAATAAGDMVAPGPRQFGANRKDARVVIEAKEEAWVRISDADGSLVFMRTLKPGETYRVPNRSGLVLDSGNAKGLAVQVDGAPAPAFIGMVRRSIPLDPETLPHGAVARVRTAPEATPPAAVAALPAATPVAAVAEPVAPPVAAVVEPPKVAFEAPPLTERPEPAVEPAPVVSVPTPVEPAPAAPAVTVAANEPAKSVVQESAAPVAEKPPVAEKAEPAAPRGELLTATLPLPAPRTEPEAVATPEIQPAAVVTPAPAPTPAPAVSVKPVVHAPAAKVAAKPEAAKPEAVKPAAVVAPKREMLKDDAAKPASLTAPRAAAAPAQVASPPVTGAAAVAPSGVISAAASRVALEVQKGTLVRLPRPASTVFVADPEIADIQIKSAGLIYIYGKRPGETALFAVDDHERVVLSTTLVVNHNVSRLRQALRAIAPDSSVDVVSIDGSLILTGTVYSPVEAENIRAVVARFAVDKGTVINQLKVAAPNQINLRVRIAEVSKDTLKQFSIDWNSVLNVGSFAFGFATSGFNNVRPFNNSLGIRNVSSNLDLNVLIDALGTEGLITLLAEPNLTAMSGETASFLAGGEFPIPMSFPRDNTISIEFKTFGVGLAFTPHILDNGRINLRVRPEVSQLSSVGAIQLSGFSIPALSTRRAETTVELASGQSFAIAGLMQHNSNQDISKVPMLGDLPVLGALFKSDRFRRSETELVIVVTPYVVRPVSANRIALPTDGFVAPNDVERILGGVTYRQQLQDRGEPPSTKEGQGLIGPTGFQLD